MFKNGTIRAKNENEMPMNGSTMWGYYLGTYCIRQSVLSTRTLVNIFLLTL